MSRSFERASGVVSERVTELTGSIQLEELKQTQGRCLAPLVGHEQIPAVVVISSKHEGNRFITAPGIGRVIAGLGMGWAAQASCTQGSLGSSRVPGQHAVLVFCFSELNILILRVVRGC